MAKSQSSYNYNIMKQTVELDFSWVIPVFGYVLLLLVGFVIGLFFSYKLKHSKFLPKKVRDLIPPLSDALQSDDENRSDVLVENPMEIVGNPDDIMSVIAPEETMTVSEQLEPEEPINGFALVTPEWAAVGASVIGSGHISSGLPCQDNNGYCDLGNGWGISVVSDGAGSAKHSDVGSKIVVDQALGNFKKAVKERHWMDNKTLPCDDEWNEVSFKTLQTIKGALALFARTKEIKLEDLNATIIVVIHSPFGLLSCHIGDGRAGYKGSDGIWRPLFTPHKGEECNQTMFLPSDYWEKPYARLFGVRIPEAVIIRDSVQAYTLMSDGCESATWECNMFDGENQKFFDPNKPYFAFFDPNVALIRRFSDEKAEPRLIKRQWKLFLEKGNKQFVNETDDKTLILVVARNH